MADNRNRLRIVHGGGGPKEGRVPAGDAAAAKVLEAEKWLSTFGPSLLSMLNPATGRLHAQYLVSGAKSGRWSARNPNIQQIPHDRDTRRIIVAAPGQVFVAGDFSSMELRAVVHISGETAMTEAFAASRDLHKLTAEAVLGVALDELGETEKERLRTLAKAVNFGSGGQRLGADSVEQLRHPDVAGRGRGASYRLLP